MIHKAILIAGLSLAGCYGVEYSHDFDRQEDFAPLRTWAWAPTMASDAEHSRRVSDLNQARIESAVESELARKGYRRVDASSADFRVRYDAAVRERVDRDSVHYDWHFGDVYVYDEGTVVIDVLGGEDERLLWRGAARSRADFDMTPEERDESIREAVAGILEKFPPEKR